LDSRTRGTYRDDHMTPDWVLDIHRTFFGDIDIDLASSAEANKHVQAKRYFSLENPCPRQVLPPLGNPVLWCNPPGPSKPVLAFWEIWRVAISEGAVGSFLCFSVDHFRLLKYHPNDTWVGFLRKRVAYRGSTGTLTIGSALIVCGVDVNDYMHLPQIAEHNWLAWG
jgi:hypothetical protein